MLTICPAPCWLQVVASYPDLLHHCTSLPRVRRGKPYPERSLSVLQIAYAPGLTCPTRSWLFTAVCQYGRSACLLAGRLSLRSAPSYRSRPIEHHLVLGA